MKLGFVVPVAEGLVVVAALAGCSHNASNANIPQVDVSGSVAAVSRLLKGAPATFASTPPIDFGNGTSVTPALGWTIQNQDANQVTLVNGSGSWSVPTQMIVQVKDADSTDIQQALLADIQAANSNYKGGLQGVMPDPPTTLQGSNFQQKMSSHYMANLITQWGTTVVYGVVTELLNPSTRLSAFINLYSNQSDALRAAEPDADAMISSMLTS